MIFYLASLKMKNMSCVSRKVHSRRRLAALTFLSNISLDGTHRDTNLSDLNLNIKFNKSTTHRLLSDCNDEVADSFPISSQTQKPANPENISKDENKECFLSTSSITDEKLYNRRQSTHIIFESIDRFEDVQKSKDRVHKFVNETKARLSNLSQKRRLSHQKSIESHGLTTGNSTESLIAGSCRSRKPSLCPSEGSFPLTAEVKFLRNVRECKNGAERMVLVSGKRSAFLLYSILPHSKLQGSLKNEGKSETGRRRHPSTLRQLAMISDGPDPLDILSLLGIGKPLEGQDISYGELLTPSKSLKTKIIYDTPSDHNTFRFPSPIPLNSSPSSCISKTTSKMALKFTRMFEKYSDKDASESSNHQLFTYHPYVLDDPEFIAGKHSTLLAFSSYITSVIDYVKPFELKKDLNDKFRERFPSIQLTLSKLRSLKKEMYKIARFECNIDLSVVAQAFVYFEKLILKLLINKHNRKYCAGACLLLSAKLNDIRGAELSNLLEKIEAVFRINRKDLIGLEFGVLVALDFSLLLNTYEILPHYHRLIYES